jgi:hypothetical protein
MDQDDTEAKTLREIEDRIHVGWRLLRDLEWLIAHAKRNIKEKTNDNNT